jgi:hypothetical protein
VSRKQPESFFRERVSEDLKALRVASGGRIYFRKIFGSLNGTPDYLMSAAGIFVAIEIKKNCRERPKKLQLYNLLQIEKSGGVSFVAYPENWTEVFEKIKAIVYGQLDATTVRRS